MMDGCKFSVSMRVRAGDLNYGNHVGHQNYFLYFQEARIAYLKQFGFSELDIAGCAMMIAEANCRYQKELFLGENLSIGCRVSRLRKRLFTMEYVIVRTKDRSVCADGFTTCLCLDYSTKKVVRLPHQFTDAVIDFEEGNLDLS
jgi:YbgC/YbaW family acyl-CoA thioester hydrolase